MSAWPEEFLCLYCGHAVHPDDEVCGNCSGEIVGMQYSRPPARPQPAPTPVRVSAPDTAWPPRRRHAPAPVPTVPVRRSCRARQHRMCGEPCPEHPYYVCTAQAGHAHDHIAHGEPKSLILATWPWA